MNVNIHSSENINHLWQGGEQKFILMAFKNLIH